MTMFHGKVSEFYADDSGGTIRDLTAYCDKVSFPQPVDVAETSTFGAASKSRVVGLRDGSVSISGKWDNTASTGPDAVLSGLLGGAAKTIAYFPAGCTVAGNHTGDATHPGYTGEAICTSYECSSDVGGAVVFSASFELTETVHGTPSVSRATGLVS